jgi:hypothetical protein
VNETPLTSDNFATASVFYSTAKEAVNSSVRFINQNEFEWPFNHARSEQTLTPGTIRYSYPISAKSVDFESFRIRRDNTLGNETSSLKKMMYEEYLQNFLDDEYNTTDTSIRSIPRHVFQTPDQNFGVYPAPDKAYKLIFEYYNLPIDLVLSTDIPSIPQDFRHVIVDGAMYYVYFFRGDIETADRLFQKFDQGIKNMRTIYINRYDYIRDTRVIQSDYPNVLRTN